MKKLMSLLTIALATQMNSVFAVSPAGYVDPKLRAINAFLEFQKVSKEPTLAVELEALKEEKYAQKGTTNAVLVSSSCGVAGCSNKYFVATKFSTKGANARVATLKAIVLVPAVKNSPVHIKLVTREMFRALLSDN